MVFSVGIHPRSLVRPLDSPLKDYEMRKGFTRKPQGDEPAAPGKNYITRNRCSSLRRCSPLRLLTRERPAVTEVVAWAASNGDRSENADYQYGSGGCGRSMGGFAFSPSESKPRKWWTRKLRERGRRRRRHSSERPCAMPMPRERSEW